MSSRKKQMLDIDGLRPRWQQLKVHQGLYIEKVSAAQINKLIRWPLTASVTEIERARVMRAWLCARSVFEQASI